MSEPSSVPLLAISKCDHNSNNLPDDVYRKLDNLPDIIYHFQIFNYLDLEDIWKLKQVSKSFYFIVKLYRVDELSFLNDDGFNYHYKDSWFSTTKSIKFRSQLPLSKLGLIKNPPDNLIHLKYLRIKELRALNFFDFPDLNKFDKLQVLEIEDVEDIIFWCYEIKLPDLKALSIKLSLNFVDSKFKYCECLKIDAPKLNYLQIYRNACCDRSLTSLINIKNPLSIKYLRLRSYESVESTFINLECLELENDKWLKADNLLKLKNLNKLKIINSERVDVLKSLYVSKSDLQFVLRGVQVKDIGKFNEYARRTNDLEFQLINYSRLERDLHFVKNLYYDDLVCLLCDNLSLDLFKKFTNIQLITIADKMIKDEERLISFMRQCSNLCIFQSIGSSLSQSFANQLTEISSLSNLIIYHNDIDLDFKFINKTPYLTNFETDQDVLINEDLNLNDLKYLKELKFNINHNQMMVDKRGKDKYILLNSQRLKELENLKRFDNNLEFKKELLIDFDRLVASTNLIRSL